MSFISLDIVLLLLLCWWKNKQILKKKSKTPIKNNEMSNFNSQYWEDTNSYHVLYSSPFRPPSILLSLGTFPSRYTNIYISSSDPHKVQSSSWAWFHYEYKRYVPNDYTLLFEHTWKSLLVTGSEQSNNTMISSSFS